MKAKFVNELHDNFSRESNTYNKENDYFERFLSRKPEIRDLLIKYFGDNYRRQLSQIPWKKAPGIIIYSDDADFNNEFEQLANEMNYDYQWEGPETVYIYESTNESLNEGFPTEESRKLVKGSLNDKLNELLRIKGQSYDTIKIGKNKVKLNSAGILGDYELIPWEVILELEKQYSHKRTI